MAYDSKEQKRAAEARDRIAEERERRKRAMRHCDCRDPLPGYPKMGQRWCKWCGKPVEEGGEG